MPFQYCCFISYRHTKEYKGKSYVECIVEDLKAEMELRVAQQVYRDTERLKGAQFYNEVLAATLCKSICMVVLFWPTYFSEEHTFCAREFKAMEELEKKRLLLLEDEAERQNGLIIILALRDFELIPREIRERRLCKDFEAHTLKPDMRRDPNFQNDVLEISRYIADRVRAFRGLASDPFTECDQFRLPNENEILPWIQQIQRVTKPTLRLPSRGLPR